MTKDIILFNEERYERFLTYELPTLEVNANIDHTFYDGANKSMTELMEIERKAFDKLAYVHSRLPPDKQEKFIEKCLPWYRVMRTLHARIRELALQDLAAQGIDPTKMGTGQ